MIEGLKEGDVVEVMFTLDSLDVDFSLLFEGVKTSQLLASRRQSSKEFRFFSRIHVKEEGKVVLDFDNSYSRFKSKVVRFKSVIHSV